MEFIEKKSQGQNLRHIDNFRVKQRKRKTNKQTNKKRKKREEKKAQCSYERGGEESKNSHVLSPLPWGGTPTKTFYHGLLGMVQVRSRMLACAAGLCCSRACISNGCRKKKGAAHSELVRGSILQELPKVKISSDFTNSLWIVNHFLTIDAGALKKAGKRAKEFLWMSVKPEFDLGYLLPPVPLLSQAPIQTQRFCTALRQCIPALWAHDLQTPNLSNQADWQALAKLIWRRWTSGMAEQPGVPRSPDCMH